MPKRIQRKRSKEWRMPSNTVFVGRPSMWGNPFKVGDLGVPDRATAVKLYEGLLFPYSHDGASPNGSKVCDLLISQANKDAIVAALRGKDLACWCPLDEPCHADILLEWANMD